MVKEGLKENILGVLTDNKHIIAYGLPKEEGNVKEEIRFCCDYMKPEDLYDAVLAVYVRLTSQLLYKLNIHNGCMPEKDAKMILSSEYAKKRWKLIHPELLSLPWLRTARNNYSHKELWDAYSFRDYTLVRDGYADIVYVSPEASGADEFVFDDFILVRMSGGKVTASAMAKIVVNESNFLTQCIY